MKLRRMLGLGKADAGRRKGAKGSGCAETVAPLSGGLAPAADEIRPFLDADYYRAAWGDFGDAQVDFARHYLEHGAAEGRLPAPWFDPTFYGERYGDVAPSGLLPFVHYVRTGLAEGRAPNPTHELARALLPDHSPEQVAASVREAEADLQQRLEHGTLAALVGKVAALDPLVRFPANEPRAIVVPTFEMRTGWATARMMRLQETAGRQPARLVVCIPHCRMSGAARVAGELVHALAALHSPRDVAVIRTDLSDHEHPEWFPDGVRHIDFAGAAAGTDPAMQQKMLFEFIRSLGPSAVFNVNSRLMWDTLKHFGAPLSKAAPVHAYLFCADLNAQGFEAGYPVEMVYRTYDHLSRVLTDNRDLARRLAERYRLADADSRLLPVATPIRRAPDPAPAPPDDPSRRPCVFWAGRFDRQKRIDVALAVAERMQQCDFRFWGKAVLDAEAPFPVPPNVRLMGQYAAFDDLPLAECDAWLYTSMWDGVPTILLDVAASAIPLVGTLVGGTGEVLAEGLSQGIGDPEDVGAHVAGLEAVLSDRRTARERALALRERLLAERSVAGFVATIAALEGVGHAGR